MALVKLHDWTLAGDGAFISQVPSFEADPATYRRAMITSDDGTCQGYERLTDGRLWSGPLVTRNQAKIDADAAAATAATTSAAAVATFRQSIHDLAVLVKAGTATGAQQRELIVKTSRACLGLMSDLP